jgi:hypothetical protein
LPAAHCECSCDCELTVIANDTTLEHTWKQFMSRWTSDCPSTCFHEVEAMRLAESSGTSSCSVNCACFKFDCVTTLLLGNRNTEGAQGATLHQ